MIYSFGHSHLFQQCPYCADHTVPGRILVKDSLSSRELIFGHAMAIAEGSIISNILKCIK
jgi:hypothetical protein